MKKRFIGLLLFLFGVAGNTHAQIALDPGFGDMIGFDLEEGDLNNFILRKDGSIVVNRVHNLAPDKKICYSLNSEGLLNTSFSGDGYLQDDTSFLMKSYAPGAVLKAADNGFLLCYNAFNQQYRFAKFDSAAGRVYNYGQQGIVATPALENFNFHVDAQNRLLYTGKCYDCLGDTFTVLRHKSDGNPDSSFGINGRKNLVFAAQNGIYLRSLETTLNDKILIGVEDRNNWFQYQYKTNGAVDSSFGGTGYSGTFIENAHLIKTLVQSDGKILMCGYSDSILVVRLHANGAIDSSFGQNGIAKIYPGWLQQAALHKDDRLVLGSNVDSAFILWQMTTSGSLDSSFGRGGIAVWKTLANGKHRMEGLAIQPDQKIIVGGNAGSGSPILVYTLAIIGRFQKDGRLDVAYTVLPADKNAQLDLYPNPAGDQLNVMYSNLAGKKATIVIYDVVGRVMQQTAINTTTNRSEIDVQSLAPGLYILELRSEDGFSARKQFLKD